jgi:hypothetical protein
MEPYIKNNVSDITYLSELILDILFNISDSKCQGLIRPDNLRSFHSVSCGLIKRRTKK